MGPSLRIYRLIHNKYARSARRNRIRWQCVLHLRRMRMIETLFLRLRRKQSPSGAGSRSNQGRENPGVVSHRSACHSTRHINTGQRRGDIHPSPIFTQPPAPGSRSRWISWSARNSLPQKVVKQKGDLSASAMRNTRKVRKGRTQSKTKFVNRQHCFGLY